jgi:hypothetical protein
MSREFVPASVVYTPPEVANYGLEAIRNVKGQTTRAAKLNISELRDYFAPVLPGQVVAIVAQTSNYKSGFIHFWERMLADQLIEEGREDEAIIHISVEECVEEQAFLYFARETGEDVGKLARGEVQDWTRLEMAATKIGTIPIYRIGDSLARAEDLPSLYMSNIYRSLKCLIEGEVTGVPITPAAIFLDYLQALPFDPDVQRTNPIDQRRLQVREDYFRLRMAAQHFRCPVIVGVQAKQHLDGAPGVNMRIPGLYDGEESSSIAQRADRIISLWMPKMTHVIGTTISHKNITFRVDENLIFIKVLKQRGGLPSGKAWKCRIDYIKNTIAPEEAFDGSQPY